MRKNWNPSGFECHFNHFLRRNLLAVHEIRRMVAQIPLKRLIPAFHIPFVQQISGIMCPCDYRVRVSLAERLIRDVNASALQPRTEFMISVRSGLLETR